MVRSLHVPDLLAEALIQRLGRVAATTLIRVLAPARLRSALVIIGDLKN